MSVETVTALFANRAQAEAAIEILKQKGFQAEEVSLVAADVPHPEDDGPADEMATGAAMGGLLGGLGAWLLGAGLLTIPVLGPVLAAGPLVAALGGAAVGAGAGGLVSALTEHGVDEEEARQIEARVRDGAVLVMVGATPRHEEARMLLCDNGALETDFSLVGDETAASAQRYDAGHTTGLMPTPEATDPPATLS
jgi:hypothetical protein